VNGWPQRLGPTRVQALIPIPLLAATALLAFGRPGPVRTVGWAGLSAAGTLTAAGWLLGRRSPRLPFATAIAVAAVDVALLVHSGSGISGSASRPGSLSSASADALPLRSSRSPRAPRHRGER
jgi:hypothetical protein